MKYIFHLVIALAAILSIQTARTAHGADTKPAATQTPEAQRAATVKAAEDFVGDYQKAAVAGRGKLQNRVLWLVKNKDRLLPIYAEFDALVAENPSLAVQVSHLATLYSFTLPQGNPLKSGVGAKQEQARIAQTGAGAYDKDRQNWFRAYVAKLDSAPATDALKKEARGLLKEKQTAGRDAYLQEILTQLAVIEKLK